MRLEWQAIEASILSPRAMLSSASQGRLREEDECPLRTCFQRDRDRLIHSKAFRRLKDKTQVFVAPEGDHYRTRLTHTLEVTQISRTIARALFLNEDLTEAIALGHDVGHTPFGHAGERSLREFSGHFEHNEQSLRVVDVIEQNGLGLNLTLEVRDGILNHCGESLPATLEGRIVRIADRIAYVNHDIDDAIRAGVLTEESLPPLPLEVLGHSHRERINTLVSDVVSSSSNLDNICLSEPVWQALMELRGFLFAKVYLTEETAAQEEVLKHKLRFLYDYYMRYPEELPASLLDHAGRQTAVLDYIAGMSDLFALQKYDELTAK